MTADEQPKRRRGPCKRTPAGIERERLRKRRWYAEHRAEASEYGRRWRAAHPEFRERANEWQKAHPEWRREYQRRRREAARLRRWLDGLRELLAWHIRRHPDAIETTTPQTQTQTP